MTNEEYLNILIVCGELRQDSINKEILRELIESKVNIELVCSICKKYGLELEVGLKVCIRMLKINNRHYKKLYKIIDDNIKYMDKGIVHLLIEFKLRSIKESKNKFKAIQKMKVNYLMDGYELTLDNKKYTIDCRTNNSPSFNLIDNKNSTNIEDLVMIIIRNGIVEYYFNEGSIKKDIIFVYVRTFIEGRGNKDADMIIVRYNDDISDLLNRKD